MYKIVDVSILVSQKLDSRQASTEMIPSCLLLNNCDNLQPASSLASALQVISYKIAKEETEKGQEKRQNLISSAAFKNNWFFLFEI